MPAFLGASECSPRAGPHPHSAETHNEAAVSCEVVAMRFALGIRFRPHSRSSFRRVAGPEILGPPNISAHHCTLTVHVRAEEG